MNNVDNRASDPSSSSSSSSSEEEEEEAEEEAEDTRHGNDTRNNNEEDQENEATDELAAATTATMSMSMSMSSSDSDCDEWGFPRRAPTAADNNSGGRQRTTAAVPKKEPNGTEQPSSSATSSSSSSSSATSTSSVSSSSVSSASSQSSSLFAKLRSRASALRFLEKKPASSTQSGDDGGDTVLEESANANANGNGNTTIAPSAGLRKAGSTRMPTLPPKDPEEESRHLKMYEKMLKESEIKDAKRRQKKLTREEMLSQTTVIWERDIIPSWMSSRKKKQTKELWKLGLPPKVRGRVWELAVGNELVITRELFDICLARAKNLTTASPPTDGEDSLSLIGTDLARTFPSLGIFQPGKPLYEPLRQVLEAFVCYRPDIGYVQGMSFLTSMLLLYMDQFAAFTVLTNMLHKKCHMAFFNMDIQKIDSYQLIFGVIMQENLPALYQHLQSIHLSPNMYLIEWFYTLYSKSLPLELAARIWDGYFLHGEIYLFKVAVGIFHCLQHEFLDQPFDVVAFAVTHLPKEWTGDDLLPHVDEVRISPKRFNSLLHQYLPSYYT